MDARVRRRIHLLPAARGHPRYRVPAGKTPNGNKELVLNFLTPHQKWGIHSTYSDNLLMLTLSRGGPVVWLSEADARSGRYHRQ
jgi:nitrate reductase alpha subunit